MIEIPQAVRVGFAFAQACWPHSHEAGSEATMIAWSGRMSIFTSDEICEAFESMATTHEKFPTLAQTMAVLRERRLVAQREEHRKRLGVGEFRERLIMAGDKPSKWDGPEPDPVEEPLAHRAWELVNSGVPIIKAITQASAEHPSWVGDKAPAKSLFQSEDRSSIDLIVDRWERHEISDQDMRDLPDEVRDACRAEVQRRWDNRPGGPAGP